MEYLIIDLLFHRKTSLCHHLLQEMTGTRLVSQSSFTASGYCFTALSHINNYGTRATADIKAEGKKIVMEEIRKSVTEQEI